MLTDSVLGLYEVVLLPHQYAFLLTQRHSTGRNHKIGSRPNLTNTAQAFTIYYKIYLIILSTYQARNLLADGSALQLSMFHSVNFMIRPRGCEKKGI